MIRKKRLTLKHFIAILIGCVIFGELLVYHMQTIIWSNISCPDNAKKCTKVLFIADPQIEGLHSGKFWHHIFIWDADRYLRKTFNIAINNFEPDILVYLGDLMDLGSVATYHEYRSYVQRLLEIFQVEYPIVQIWLPGDNDIGGENEPIAESKVREFEIVFAQPHIIFFQDIRFVKVNGITRRAPKLVDEMSSYTVILSHYPLYSKSFIRDKVDNIFKPDIYFFAHTHESFYVVQNSTNKIKSLFYSNDVLDIKPDNFSHEINVPTCSYRMGTVQVGFGAAVIDSQTKSVKYTVLWSPNRFLYLFGYLVVIVSFILYALFSFIVPRCFFCFRLGLLFIAILIVSFIFGPYLASYIHTYDWPDLTCPKNDKKCSKVLFVANPKIQGQDSQYWLHHFIEDDDNFLKKTFSVVLNYFEPDVIVYLGDLMYLGVSVNNKEFYRYLNRLFEIFEVNFAAVIVYLPKDIEVGRKNKPENHRPLTLFYQPDVIIYQGVSFLKVYGPSWHAPNNIHRDWKTNFNVILSPFTVLADDSRTFMYGEIEDTFKPDIYFCAQKDDSLYVIHNHTKRSHFPLHNRVMLDVVKTEEVTYEVQVPTCSYRNRTGKIGYGAALIQSDKKSLKYTVFWSPNRFLYIYARLTILIALISVMVLIYLLKQIVRLIFENYIKYYLRTKCRKKNELML